MPHAVPQPVIRRSPAAVMGAPCAFTLVEMLVVVAIIALLVSILLPSLKQARAIAKQTVCLSNERQMGVAMRLYQTQWNGWLPMAGNYTNTPLDLMAMTLNMFGYSHYEPVPAANVNVGDSVDVFYTIAGTTYRNFYRLPPEPRNNSIFRCPAQPPYLGYTPDGANGNRYGQYAYNMHLGHYKLSLRHKPSEFKMPPALTGAVICRGGDGGVANTRGFYIHSSVGARSDYAEKVHLDKSTLLLLDGHATPVALEESLSISTGHPDRFFFDMKYVVEPIKNYGRPVY